MWRAPAMAGAAQRAMFLVAYAWYLREAPAPLHAACIRDVVRFLVRPSVETVASVEERRQDRR
jgi:hypothetical protein